MTNQILFLGGVLISRPASFVGTSWTIFFDMFLQWAAKGGLGLGWGGGGAVTFLLTCTIEVLCQLGAILPRNQNKTRYLCRSM